MIYSRLSAGALSTSISFTDSSVICCGLSTPERKPVNLSTASLSNAFSSSSFLTPSSPTLSILSKVIHTLSSWLFKNPQSIRNALNSLLSFTLTLKFFIPIALSALVVIRISSTSESLESEPIISISHCTNSRSLPFCGRSALYTLSICIHFIGSVSLSLLFAKYLLSGSVRSYLNPISARTFSFLEVTPLASALSSLSPLFIILNIRFRFSPPSLLSRFSMSSITGVVICSNPFATYTFNISF